MPCRLCLRDKPLRRSHILPEFVYSRLYNRNHRFQELATDEGRGLVFRQQGLREFLLCDDCEVQFSKYETYVSPFLMRPGGLKISSKTHPVLNKVEYAKFKLFQLSILWRAHVATHPIFRRVNLGAKHSEKLRLMLHHETAGEPYEYGCMMIAADFGDTPMADFISPAIRYRDAGHNHYALIFAGFTWLFAVSSHTRTHWQNEFFLKRNGSLVIYPYNFSESRGFRDFALGLYNANKTTIEKFRNISGDLV
jgi:hypothetical protein